MFGQMQEATCGLTVSNRDSLPLHSCRCRNSLEALKDSSAQAKNQINGWWMVGISSVHSAFYCALQCCTCITVHFCTYRTVHVM
jgi:hypothetical protein